METDQDPMMDSRALSTIDSSNFDLAALPARLDDRQLAQVDAIAGTSLTRLEPCGEEYLLQILRSLWATLPKRATDQLSGKLMAANYARILGHHPREAITYWHDKALRQCKFFPSIQESEEILSTWIRQDLRDRSKAQTLASRERQERMEDLMRAIGNGAVDRDQLDALPNRWKQIAETRGLIWIDPDGSCRLRSRGLLEIPSHEASAADLVDQALGAFPSSRPKQ